ncbi:hypothetical protein PG990_009199 [Apiospora arundinis]
MKSSPILTSAMTDMTKAGRVRQQCNHQADRQVGDKRQDDDRDKEDERSEEGQDGPAHDQLSREHLSRPRPWPDGPRAGRDRRLPPVSREKKRGRRKLDIRASVSGMSTQLEP